MKTQNGIFSKPRSIGVNTPLAEKDAVPLFPVTPLEKIHSASASGGHKSIVHKPCALVRWCAGALFLYFTFIYAQDEIESHKEELEKFRQKIRAIEEKIKALSREEKGVLSRISALEEKISLTQKFIKELTNAQRNKETEIHNVRVSIKDTESRIQIQKEDLEYRLVALYKYGRIFPVEVVLSSRSIPDIYRKLFYLRFVAEENSRLVKELAELKEKLKNEEKKLNAALFELTRLQEERKREANSLRSAKDLEAKVLKKVRNEKSQNLTLEQELREAAARLERLIAELERQRRERKLPKGSHILEITKGNIPWPVRGKVIAGFGNQTHPKYKTKIKNSGIDISCAPGSDVKAIANGRVVYADRFMGYGNLVIIDHNSGYYSLYSNLSEILSYVGTEVKAGDVIAKSDVTLHFELRKEGKPVDPIPWLSQVTR